MPRTSPNDRRMSPNDVHTSPNDVSTSPNYVHMSPSHRMTCSCQQMTCERPQTWNTSLNFLTCPTWRWSSKVCWHFPLNLSQTFLTFRRVAVYKMEHYARKIVAFYVFWEFDAWNAKMKLRTRSSSFQFCFQNQILQKLQLRLKLQIPFQHINCGPQILSISISCQSKMLKGM